MAERKHISYKLIIMLLIVTLILPSITIPSFASASDYSLTNKTVVLDGENDGEVEISLVTAAGGTFYALQSNWTLSEKENSSYFTLSNLVAGGTASPSENNPATGNIVWADSSYTGFSVAAGGAIWKAKYTIDKDTPAGTYTVGLTIDAITGGTAGFDSDENIPLTAIITVERQEHVTPFTASFNGDSTNIASIGVYNTQNYKTNNTAEADATFTSINDAIAYARDGNSGDILADGNGEISFKVVPKAGYSANVSVTPSSNFNSLQQPSETGVENMYCITKVTGDVTITITTTKNPYKGTFVTDSGVSGIDIYYKQSYENDNTVQADETNVTNALARNGSTGLLDTTGSGQINFRVNLKDNYLIDSVTVSGNYESLKDSAEIGVDNTYRITKITSDLTITVTTKKRTSIVPEITGYESSYEYTGNSIKPTVVVNIYGESTTLVEGTDYTVTYGSNTNLGTGTIYINPVDTSDYVFTQTQANFNIVAKAIKESDITIPASITYTGSSLSPEVVVYANNKTLEENKDYTVTYSNQNGVAGENVTVVINGIGNYSGSITKQVLITPKPSRNVEQKENITMTYGDIKNYTDTADCEVTYTSSNENVVSVTHSYASSNSTNKLKAVGTGEAVITVTYPETTTYSETTTTFTVTVEKAELTITNATVNNKKYDGTTAGTVKSVTFDNSNANLTLGTDYTATAQFTDASVGTDKTAIVTITLLGDTANNYKLKSNTFNSIANITAITITSENITIDPTSYEYDGTAKEPTVTIEIDGVTLTKNTDYTIEYSNNIDIGTGKVKITGKGNYTTGTNPITKTFTITQKTITPTIAPISDVTYNGKEQKPKLTVTAGDISLEEGIDYTVSYSANINAGTATATISKVSGGNYIFSDVSKTFTINKYTLTESDVSLEYTTIRYDGTAKKPNVTVTLNGSTVAPSNYSVNYTNNTEVGTATVTVTATGSNFNTSADPVEKTFTIADKEVLTISGITDNQSITYTGSKVELKGTLTVGNNDKGITVSDLTTTWYNQSGNTIEQPTDVGTYMVEYSYSDADYVGSLSINFTITKKKSENPAEASSELVAIEGQTLADVALATPGLSWVDNTTTILAGKNSYLATYTQNNDTKNYTTETINIKVYGKTHINITTSVNGSGGTISDSIENVLEGTAKTIELTPAEGYEISKVTVNGKEQSITNNKLTVTAGTEDLKIVVTYKVIKYKITIRTTNAEANPNGIVTVNYNSNQEITIKANYGYKLTSVLVGNTEMISELENDVLTISNITSDKNVIITAEKITYEYTDGAGQIYTIGQDTTATFRIDADYSLFDKVYIDDALVDSAKYKVQSGSTIITFTKDYMESLAVGIHTLKVAYQDGGEATTTFTIENPVDTNSTNDPLENPNEDKNPTNNVTNLKTNLPKAGDSIIKYVIIAIISMLVILMIVIYRKKRASKK